MLDEESDEDMPEALKAEPEDLHSPKKVIL